MKNWISYYRSKCFCFSSIVFLLFLIILNVLFWNQTINTKYLFLEFFALFCSTLIYFILIFPTFYKKRLKRKAILYDESLDATYPVKSSFFLCNHWLVSLLFGNFFIIHTASIVSFSSQKYKNYTKFIISCLNDKQYVVLLKVK